MLLIKIFYGFLFLLCGIGLIKYRKIIKGWTGNFGWAERLLGSGGTYLVIILLGLALIFFGVIYPFGGLDLLFDGGENKSPTLNV